MTAPMLPLVAARREGARFGSEGDPRFPSARVGLRAAIRFGVITLLAASAGWQRWLFVGLAVVASVVIVWLLKRHAAQLLFCFAIAMVLGGAVGNLIDRVWHGYVVDWIHVHYRSFDFPAFNLADSAITLGAICLIADELRRVRRS